MGFYLILNAISIRRFMKNQYVADIGDYGKYSLLKAFSDEGIKLGINWYLTPNEDSNDGKYVDYLTDDSFRRYNPDVYDALKEISKKDDKTVKDIENSNIFTNVKYYSELMDFDGTPKKREELRSKWFNESMNVLADAELIFMDPDNGLLENGDAKKLGAEKYILAKEAKQYYENGHNVAFYCHKGRRTWAKWDEYKEIVPKLIPDAKTVVLTFHKGTQRSYIFLIHSENFIRYKKIIDSVLSKWYKIFTEEPINNKKSSDELVGESFVLETSSGVIFTFSKRADGKIAVKKSDNKNSYLVVDADRFCERFSF